MPVPCGFEDDKVDGLYCGLWADLTTDTFDWSQRSGSTPSSGTGPSAAAEGTRYLFTETSSPRQQGDTATLQTSGKVQQLTLQYHMLGSNIGTLRVQWSAAGTGSWTEVFQQSGAAGSAWRSTTVDFPASCLSGSGGCDVRITGVRGDGWAGDIAIDDVTLTGVFSFTDSPTASPSTLSPVGTAPCVDGDGVSHPHQSEWTGECGE
eukprot:gene16708-46829_t